MALTDDIKAVEHPDGHITIDYKNYASVNLTNIVSDIFDKALGKPIERPNNVIPIEERKNGETQPAR